MDLSSNKIQILSEGISKLIELEHLDLSDNQLQALPEGLSNLKKLKKLDLSENPLASVSVIKYLETAPKGLAVTISKDLVNEIKASKNYKEIISRCHIRYLLDG